MIDIGSAAALISSLKTAAEITKSMIGLRNASVIQSKAIELNRVILTAQTSALEAQTAQFGLLERVRELEEEIARVEAWEAEKRRYQLTDFGSGTFAYVLKPDMTGGEPSHCLCAACYQKGQKSILQFSNDTVAGQKRFFCPNCEKEFLLGTRQEPPGAESGGSWMAS